MNPDREILDGNSFDAQNKGVESRFVRVVRIIVGVILTALAGLFLFGLVFDMYRVISSLSTNEFFANDFNWGSWFLNKSLSMLYIVSFFIGGIGLLRSRVIGWVFSVASAICVILNIGFSVFQIMFYYGSPGGFGIYGWVLLGIVAIFSTIVFLLLSKPFRNHFKPTMRIFGIGGLIILIFVIDTACIWLFR